MVEGKPIERYPGLKPLSSSFESPYFKEPGITGVLADTAKFWEYHRRQERPVTTQPIIPPTPSQPVSAPAPSGTLAAYSQAKSEIRSGPQGIYSGELQARLDSASREEEASRLQRLRESKS